MIKVIYKNAEDGTNREEKYQTLGEIARHIKEELEIYDEERKAILKSKNKVIYSENWGKHHTWTIIDEDLPEWMINGFINGKTSKRDKKQMKKYLVKING